MKKLPILQWSLDICAILLFSLMVYFANLCRIPLTPSGICSEFLREIILLSFAVSVFFMTMREAILHPFQHKIAWSFFTAIALFTSLYNINADWSGIISLILAILLFPSCIVFFFLDRNNSTNLLSQKKTNAYFYIVFSSIIYAFALYYGLHGRDWSFIVPTFCFPFFISSFFVWIYRGWGLKGFGLSLILIPFVLFSVVITSYLFIFVYINCSVDIMLGTWYILSILLSVCLLNKFEKTKKLK